MFTYSLRTLLASVAMASLVCVVALVLKPIPRVAVLFALVLAMPAPLAVMLWRGGIQARSFALGSIAVYAAWLLLCGLPCAAMVAYHFIVTRSVHDYWGLYSMMDEISKGYAGCLGLYLPWLIVPLGGLVGLLAHECCVPSTKPSTSPPDFNSSGCPTSQIPDT